MTVTVPGVRLPHQVTTAAALDGAVPGSGPAGLVLGFDQDDRPVTLRLHGGEAARVVLIGGLPCARLLAFRAVGMGLRCLVRSPRPAAWEPFAAAVNDGRELVSIADQAAPEERAPRLPALRTAGVGLRSLTGRSRAALPIGPGLAGSVRPPAPAADPPPAVGNGPGLAGSVRSARPATALDVAAARGGSRLAGSIPQPERAAADDAPAPEIEPPLAVILDTGSITADLTPRAEPSQVTLLLREEVTTWDSNALTWADVVLLQRLTEAEAALAAKALRIDDAEGELSRLDGDLTAVVCQGTVTRVRLRPTAAELDLIGPPARP